MKVFFKENAFIGKLQHRRWSGFATQDWKVMLISQTSMKMTFLILLMFSKKLKVFFYILIDINLKTPFPFLNVILVNDSIYVTRQDKKQR